MTKIKKTPNPHWQQAHLVITSDWRVPASPDFLGIFQSAREAMFLIDGRGIIRFWNLGAELLFGYSGDEIINTTAESLIQGGWPVHGKTEKSRNGKNHDNMQVTQLIEATGMRKDGSQFQLEISIGGESSGGGGLGLIFARELTGRLQKNPQVNEAADERLQYRIRFENLITSISTHFIHLPSEKVDKGISYALHTLGEFAGVDRAYIFLFSSDQATVDNTHEWCSKGVEPQILHLQGLPVSRFPWFMERIKSLNTIYVPNVHDLPESANAEREEFEREKITSLVIVPMVYRGELRGYLGFDSVHQEKKWSDDIIGLLRIVGEMFINALERKQLDKALSEISTKYLNIFENTLEGIFQSSSAGHFLGMNPPMARIFGFQGPEDMQTEVTDIGRQIYVDPERRHEFVRLLRERGHVRDFESQVKRKDGVIIWISENARAVRKPDGRLDYCEGTVMEVTERKAMEARLIHSTLHDALTGLPNRNLLKERIGKALAHNNPERFCAVLMIDLDRFTMVNNSRGHLFGDRMLIAFARRLESCLSPNNTLARLGGDEFCVLLEGLKDGGAASELAQTFQESLSHPFELDGQELYTAASIGIAITNGKSTSLEDLLRDADIALQRAKTSGKGRCEVFDTSMHARAVQLHTLETDLRKALERQEFRLHYQPIVSLLDSKLIGFEALIRWIHPKLGLVSPMDFIPLAEDTGLIIPIGRWVLWQSCKQLAEWQNGFLNGQDLTMAINLSGKQLQDQDLVRQIKAILSESKVEARSLKLEVTESAIMANPEKAALILNSLKDLGIHLSLDDFGTGYSSLSYLHRFPFQNLKIDRSFVSKMESGDKDTEIVKVINSLAKNLGMDVVAEGIETVGQWALLNGLDCAYGQGYYFSKPLEDSAARSLIERGGFILRGPNSV